MKKIFLFLILFCVFKLHSQTNQQIATGLSAESFPQINPVDSLNFLTSTQKLNGNRGWNKVNLGQIKTWILTGVDTTKSWMTGYGKNYGTLAYLKNNNGYIIMDGAYGVVVKGADVNIQAGNKSVWNMSNGKYGIYQQYGSGTESGSGQTFYSGEKYPTQEHPNNSISLGDQYHRIANGKYTLYGGNSNGWVKFIDSTELAAQMINKPNLSQISQVGFTGNYNDLTNKPEIQPAQPQQDLSGYAAKSELPNFSSSAFIQKNGDGSNTNPYNFSVVTGQVLDSVFIPKTAPMIDWALSPTSWSLTNIPSSVPTTATYAGMANVWTSGVGSSIGLIDTSAIVTLYWDFNTQFTTTNRTKSMIRVRKSYINNVNYQGAWLYFNRNIFPYVSSFNGAVGAVTGVKSVNYQTGDVLISVKDTAVYGSYDGFEKSTGFGQTVGDYVEILKSGYSVAGKVINGFKFTVNCSDKSKTYEVNLGYVGTPVYPMTTPSTWLTLAPISNSDQYYLQDDWDVEMSYDRNEVRLRVRRKSVSALTGAFQGGVFWSIRNTGFDDRQWINTAVTGNDAVPCTGIFASNSLVTFRGNTTLLPNRNGTTYTSSKFPYPDKTFKVLGTIKTDTLEIPTGAGIGKVLTSDANGVASWQTSASSDSSTYFITQEFDGNTGETIAEWMEIPKNLEGGKITNINIRIGGSVNNTTTVSTILKGFDSIQNITQILNTSSYVLPANTNKIRFNETKNWSIPIQSNSNSYSYVYVACVSDQFILAPNQRVIVTLTIKK